MMSRKLLPILYRTSPGVLRSRWVSGFTRAVLSGGLPLSSGIGFVHSVVQKLSIKWIDSILLNSVLDCSAQAHLLRPDFEENCAPVRSALKIFMKSRCRAEHPEGPMRSILNILKKLALPCRAS